MDDVVTEADVQAQIQLALSRGSCRLFRIGAGRAWAGDIVQRTPKLLTLANYYMVRLAVPGYPDLSGWSEGGIWTGVEVKSPKGRERPEQRDFIDQALAAGCRAGFAKSVEDAREIVEGQKNAPRT